MKNENTWDISFKTMKSSLIIFSIFLAIGLWIDLTRNIGYLANFVYIGGVIAVGGFMSEALPRKHRTWGRRITQIFIALYLLGFMGVAFKENMQIEGFFFYLLMGIFGGATMHYFVAKSERWWLIAAGAGGRAGQPWCSTCSPGANPKTDACAAGVPCAMSILPCLWDWCSLSGTDWVNRIYLLRNKW
jgi:hypothetical protein